MQKLKNLLFCLVFSFIFLFGSIFSVQAGHAALVKESQVLKQCIAEDDYPNEKVECTVDYVVQNIRNNGEKKIILSIDNVKCRIAKHSWNRWDSLYRFDTSQVEISKDKNSALIHVSVYRISGILLQEKKIDLTFELKVN